MLVGTATGDVYPKLEGGKPVGDPVHVCDGRITGFDPYAGRQRILVSCDVGATSQAYVYDATAGRATAVPGVSGRALWTINADGLAYITPGACELPAPICKTRLALRDLRTGRDTVIDERYGVATDFRRTLSGITIYRARNNDSFVRDESEVGTYLVNGTTLFKLSSLRLVDGDKGRWLLESEDTPTKCCTYLVLKTDTERRITPPDVQNEKGLAMLPDGRLVAFRPRQGLFEGTIVVYANNATGVLRTDPGRFAAHDVVMVDDWLIGFEYSGAPALTLRAYRVTDGAFASAPGNNVSALAPFPLK